MNAINIRSNRAAALSDDCLDRPGKALSMCGTQVCQLSWAPEVRAVATTGVADEALDRPGPSLWSHPGCHLCWTSQQQVELHDETLDRPGHPSSMCGCGFTDTVFCWAPDEHDAMKEEALDRPAKAAGYPYCKFPDPEHFSVERSEPESCNPSSAEDVIIDQALDRPRDTMAFSSFSELFLEQPALKETLRLRANCGSECELADEALDRPTEVVAATAGFCRRCHRPETRRGSLDVAATQTCKTVVRMSDYRVRKAA